MARLSTETREKVVTLRQQGLSQSEISRQTGVSRCAVQALLKKHKETGDVEDRRRSGRPRKLSAADETHIMLTSLCNRKKSSSAISSELAETSGTQVHPSTVWRSLVRSSLHGRIVAKKPYLQRGNKAKRLNYARKHRNWGAEKWQQFLSRFSKKMKNKKTGEVDNGMRLPRLYTSRLYRRPIQERNTGRRKTALDFGSHTNPDKEKRPEGTDGPHTFN